ncbi:MAG: hypothetical protein C0404_10370 [Verrucomicrobia bacterium]|nr:hypothetical protein [Verrucomicrobiota bacterium]
MDRAIEKKMSQRAVALGNAGDGRALAELAQLLKTPSAEVRRLAASAIGKLAGLTDAAVAVAALTPMVRDVHPQVRQYAVKALKAFGVAAKPALNDLRDMAGNASEKDYNRHDATLTIETIEEAVRIAEKQAVHKCQRCGLEVTADEYARAQKAFQRTFCDKCFDETYLKRRNFDTKVELNKTIPVSDGTLVQSDGERIIAEWLTAHGIAYRYDERFRILEGHAIRPDFYLPELDVYIEYWGMDTADYKIGMLKKQQLYQQEGKRLVSLYWKDKPKLAELLAQKLAMFMGVPGASKPAP